MAAFNSMPVMSAATTNDAMGMNHTHNHNHNHNHTHGHGPPMGMDHFDQELGFDEALLDGAALAPLPFTPAYDFDNFASTFEDPFSYSTRQFEPPQNHQDALNEESSPQELDNKLLGFSDPAMLATVLDETGKFADMNMGAELYGMFFVAEDVFGGETAGRPLELTCYRRNLWQCSGQVTLPRSVTQVIDEQGRQLPIFELMASITALESIEGKATEIISIPWKNANPQIAGAGAGAAAGGGGAGANGGAGAAAAVGEDGKTPAAPPNISLDLSAGQELDANRVSLPISWKRLQFKHATANNGRRKGLQQHYVVQINLLAKVKTGEIIKIAEIQSGPVIVRGRSPRNFDSRKDVPLTGEKKAERKNTASSDQASLKVERDTLQATMQMYQSVGGSTPSEWAAATPVPQPSQSPHHPAKRLALSPSMARPPVPAWSGDGNGLPKNANGHGQQAHRGSMSRPNNGAVPINLSLSEDERSPNRSSAELQSPQMGKSHAVVGPNAGSSPPEEADPLYEYFPLSVDDWMPPVDAVYRPHVVHHTIVPPEIKAQQSGSRSTKRYFLAE